MSRLFWVLAIVAFAFRLEVAAAQTPDSGTTDTIVAGCRLLVSEFQAELQAELLAAMKDSGAGAAIGPCLITAPALAKSFSSLGGWQVRRTALRLRNPRNAPDQIEERALAVLEEDSANEFTTWTSDTANHMQLRYLSAIRLRATCVGCHGEPSRLSESVKGALRELYPDDRATGFKPGDLRGAFSIIVDWPEGRTVADSLYKAVGTQNKESQEDDGTE